MCVSHLLRQFTSPRNQHGAHQGQVGARVGQVARLRLKALQVERAGSRGASRTRVRSRKAGAGQASELVPHNRRQGAPWR